jgi:hypothetical protein
MSQQLLDQGLLIAGNILLGLLAWALTKLTAWIAAKVKSEKAKHAITMADDIAMTVIRSTYQSFVKPLKAGNGWTKEASEQARAAALAELKSYLGVKGLAELQKLLPGDLDAFLGALIDESVHNNKLFAKSVSAASPLASAPSA